MRSSCRGLGVSLLLVLTCLQVVSAAEPKNVIVFIADGLGPEHMEATRMYLGEDLFFESLPHMAMTTTYSANSDITESASAATSMATGHKVDNCVVAMAYPGDGGELETTVEYYRDRGKLTGLVTTMHITDYTPAGFAAHEPYRDFTANIASDYLTQTRPNVLFGGGGHWMTTSAAAAAGYTVVEDRAELFALDTEAETYVSGQFGSTWLPCEYDGLGDLPHLSDMTQVALDVLDNDPNGFFLMVEGGLIDGTCHAHDLPRTVGEIIEFDNTIEMVMDWASTRTDTLVVVTSDHETGGLSVLADNGPGNYPTVEWGTWWHTGVDVPTYAWGLNAHTISGVIDNTDIYHLTTMSESSDFDGDGDADCDDIDTLCANMGGDPATYDLNSDGTVDSGDMDYLVTNVIGTCFGDSDLDRMVNATDLACLASAFGDVGGWACGNFNVDGVVNATDLAILATDFGFGAPASEAPEPITMALLATGAFGLLANRRRR